MQESAMFKVLESKPSYPAKKLIIGQAREGDCAGCGKQGTCVSETCTAAKCSKGYSDARIMLCKDCLGYLISNHNQYSTWMTQLALVFVGARKAGRYGQ